MNKVKLACDLQSLSRNVIMLVLFTAAVIVLVPFLVLVAFTKCVHIRKFLDIYKVRSSTVDTKSTHLWTVICPKKLTLAHNVFEVTELCRTRADISKPSLDH